MGEDTPETYFSRLVRSILDKVNLSTPEVSKRLFLFTDASFTNCSSVLRQALKSDVDLSVLQPQELDHEPVFFVSGALEYALRW